MKIPVPFDESSEDKNGSEVEPGSRSHEQLMAYALDLSRTYRELRETHAKLEDVYISTLASFVGAMEARDHYLDGHTKSVLSYALPLGQELGLSAKESESLQRAVLLHDIGKIGVPDSVLKKPGPLDKTEWFLMRRHPEIGYQILAGLSFLGEAALLGIRHHHERFDGRGYPSGLARTEIPFLARLLSACDAFDAMTSNRPYRRGLPRDRAIDQLVKGRGAQFDPEIVEALVPIVERNGAHGRPSSVSLKTASPRI